MVAWAFWGMLYYVSSPFWIWNLLGCPALAPTCCSHQESGAHARREQLDHLIQAVLLEAVCLAESLDVLRGRARAPLGIA